jgi:hypothetical protein
MAHELHYGWVEANGLATFACVASAMGAPTRAARLGAAATRLAGTLAVSIVPDHRAALDDAMAATREKLREAMFGRSPCHAHPWQIGVSHTRADRRLG